MNVPSQSTAADFNLLDTSMTYDYGERRLAGIGRALFFVIAGSGTATLFPAQLLLSGFGPATVSPLQASTASIMGLESKSIRLLSGGPVKVSPVEHAIARFKRFALLQDDWDDRGAVAPDQRAIDAAMRFVVNLQPWHPAPFATVDSEGHPVIELNDATTNYFGSITFLSENEIELYVHRGDRPSTLFEGKLSSAEARKFLRVEMQIALP